MQYYCNTPDKEVLKFREHRVDFGNVQEAMCSDKELLGVYRPFGKWAPLSADFDKFTGGLLNILASY